MTIWNPFIFSPSGGALPPGTPPVLRVMDGGQPTAQQLTWSQNVFYSFCDRMRGSVAPNPVESGRLPDGSAYKIMVVGNSTTMLLWVGADDSLRNSGIAFTLSYLDGASIPGHADEDGVPVTYLLTPREVKGTRIASGKWAVRKPPFVQGGKVVNADRSGLTYYAGVEGELDREIPSFRDYWLSVNGQAYAHEDHTANTPLWWNSRQSGRSRGNATPLPFLHTTAQNEKFAMQLDVRLQYIPEEDRSRYFIDLYVGKFRDTIDGHVGDLVGTEPLGNLTIDYRSITFSADGRRARAVGTDGPANVYLLIDITPARTLTSVLSTSGVGEARVQGTKYLMNETVDTSTTGPPGEIGSTQTFTRTQRWDAGLGESLDADHFGSIPTYPGSYTYTPPSQRRLTYGRRGEPLDDRPAPGRLGIGSTDFIYFSETITEEGIPDVRRWQKIVQTFQQNALVTVDGEMTYRKVYDAVVTTYSPRAEDLPRDVAQLNTGFVTEITVPGGNAIFEDIDLDFLVERMSLRSRQHMEYEVVEGEFGQFIQPGPEVVTVYAPAKIHVKCRGATLLNETFDEAGGFEPVVFVASDPMTGALVVSVQDRHGITMEVVKSWIFVVDDTGARLLPEIMKTVLPGTDIKVSSNAVLISV